MGVNDAGNDNRYGLVSTENVLKSGVLRFEVMNILGIAMPQIIFRTTRDPAAERAGEGTSGPTNM